MERNQFHKEGGFYIHERSSGDFYYSDGQGIEKYLKAVLENATDLSSCSVELETAIQDWATEYHLSSRRANLLRAFDISGCKKALELGCGCGAITRYLGEQGIEVDAVEGSPARAELASLRCRDLGTVTVFCGNFNEIELPEKHYDLICLVGVAEYAARFMESPGRDVDPVVLLLDRLKAALKPKGILMIAIENRIGMKYVFGAHEDHYGRKYVGINDYFGEKDINTYTLPEWEKLFHQLGVKHKKVYLPFPDYKLPTVLLSQHFVKTNPDAFSNLEGTESRDYVEVFKPQTPESLIWQAAAASGSMDVFSNSFLFVLSMGNKEIGKQYCFDFAHLPSFRRHREYCLTVIKPEGKEKVVRKKLIDDTMANEIVDQVVIQEPFRQGSLLSVLWSRALLLEPDGERFISLVKEYVAYIRNRATLSIDLTPSNIVVERDNKYVAFDEEWIAKKEISIEYLLFRSLLIFVLKTGNAITAYAKTRKLETVKDFILHAGNSVGLDLGRDMEDHVEMEEQFQNSLAASRTGNMTLQFLEKPIHIDKAEAPPVSTRVYWRQEGEPYTETCCRYLEVEDSDDVQTLTFKLPPAALKAHQFRFNPCELSSDNHRGFMRFFRIEVFSTDPRSGVRTSAWKMAMPDDIAKYSRMSDMEYSSTGLGWVFMATGDEPWFEFVFVPRTNIPEDNYVEFEVEMSLPRSKEYRLARDRYLSMEERLREKLENIEEINKSYGWMKKELEEIKGANYWKVVQRYIAVRQTLDGIIERIRFWGKLRRRLGTRRTLARARRQVLKRFSGFAKPGTVAIGPPTRYEVWRDRHLARGTQPLPMGPLISIVMPVYNVNGDILHRAVESLRNQTYKNWELCIADDASTREDTLKALDRIRDKRIKVQRLSDRRNISGATNTAVEMAKGDFLAFMDNDDELPDNALYEIAAAILRDDPDIIYTDEDFIKTDYHLDYPHFKPDYNPDLLLSHNYVTHLLVMKKELFIGIGKLRSDYDGAQDYDLVLRAVEGANKILHIPKPLYHWRMTKTSTSLNPTIKPGGHSNAKKALEAALARRRIDATVEETSLPHFFRVRRRIAGSPLVSIIIPFKDKPGFLRNCITSLIGKTTYSNYEILGISNDSHVSSTYDEMRALSDLDDRIRFHELNIRFNFSRLVNFGVNRAKGEHIVLVNNDIEVITPDWIEALLEHSQRSEVAAVGAKLYYPDNTIQHAGIAVGLGGYAGHMHSKFRADSRGYFNRLHVVQNVSAVTGAFMMVQKAKYLEIGMFDEEVFGVAYNDVDFCLRAMEQGYLNVFTPHVEAYHHESVSRGYEDTAEKLERFRKEKENLKRRHGVILQRGDPYYSPNFDQNRDDFRLPS